MRRPRKNSNGQDLGGIGGHRASLRNRRGRLQACFVMEIKEKGVFKEEKSG